MFRRHTDGQIWGEGDTRAMEKKRKASTSFYRRLYADIVLRTFRNCDLVDSPVS